MTDAVALSGGNPIEADIYEELALIETKASKKVEEEGTPHAISAALLANEANAAQEIETQQWAPATPSKRGMEQRRYQNPILAIFAVMSVARKTMQDVAKNSKEETRVMKKHWERISHEVSDHHDTAAKNSDKIQQWSSIVGMVVGFGPKLIQGRLSPDTMIPGLGITEFQQSRNAWTDSIRNVCENWDPLLGRVYDNRWTPDHMLTNALTDNKTTVEWVNWLGQTGQKMSEPFLQQWGQSSQMANQRDVAVGQQQSEASRVEYQSRQDEKRNEDEAVKTIDQMNQRLMEQEVRAFEVRG